MLQRAGMSHGFWESAVATATHVRNRAPSCATNYISPHERLLGCPPDLSYLRTFGCLAYAHTTTQRTKFDPTSKKFVFIGYDGSTKGYKLWELSTHKIIVSADVVLRKPYILSALRPLQSRNQTLLHNLHSRHLN